MTLIDQHLDVLGLKRGVSKADLKSAYRALIRVSHPDKFPHDDALKTQAEERTKRLNEAYTFLTRNFEQISQAENQRPEPTEIPTGRIRTEDEKRRRDAEYQRRKALREATEALRLRQDAQIRRDKQTRILGIAFVILLILYIAYTRNHPTHPGWVETPAEVVEEEP